LLSTSATLIVPGAPVAWARARRKGKQYFTSPEVAEYRDRVQTAWLIEGRPNLGEGSLAATLWFVLPRPDSHWRANGELRKTAMEYPRQDVDNLAKGVLDALNTLAYHDDSQVTDLHVMKRYANQEEEPHTEVELDAL
jgi:Holliday junction resolvase RusA-like endonuclease